MAPAPADRPPDEPDLADLDRKPLWEARLDQVGRTEDSKGELKARAECLTPGHASSPRDENGRPRPPVPSLADVCLPECQLTDDEYADHIKKVETALENALGLGLATEKQFTVNPDHDIWCGERAALHDQIIEDAYAKAADVPCDRQSIIAGGLPGAGKTTVLEQHVGIDRSSYLIINPDHFKEELARRGLVPTVDGLSPMEASTLAHEESSYLARQLALRAQADGKNVIWDVTMSSTSSTAGRIEELRSCGYRVEGIFVHIPVEVSVARAEVRHRRDHDEYRAGNGFGGRYQPADVVRAQFDREYGSRNRRAFEELKQKLDYWRVLDNSADGSPPMTIEEGGPQEPWRTINDQ